MSRRMLRFFASIFLVASMPGCWPAGGGVAPPAVKTISGPTDALPLRAKLDLGVIEQGKSVSLACWMTNQGKTPVQVSKIESSCDCLTTTLSKMQVAPGERVLVRAHYDGAKEPDFIGSLQIEVRLLDDGKSGVGQIDIPIEVMRADSSQSNNG